MQVLNGAEPPNAESPTEASFVLSKHSFKKTRITGVLSTGEVTSIVLRTADDIGSYSYQGLQSHFKPKRRIEISLELHFDISQAHKKTHVYIFFPVRL